MINKKMVMSCIAIAYIVGSLCETVFNLDSTLANIILILGLGIYSLYAVVTEYRKNGIGKDMKEKSGFVAGTALSVFCIGFSAYWSFLFIIKFK